MFTLALFIITPNWRQFRCPSAGEWINNLCQTETMEDYSVMEWRELITERWDVMDGYQKCYAKWKEPDAKGYLMYGLIYMKLHQRQIWSILTERRLVLAWDRIFMLLEYCLYNQYFDSDSVFGQCKFVKLIEMYSKKWYIL